MKMKINEINRRYTLDKISGDGTGEASKNMPLKEFQKKYCEFSEKRDKEKLKKLIADNDRSSIIAFTRRIMALIRPIDHVYFPTQSGPGQLFDMWDNDLITGARERMENYGPISRLI